MVKLKNFMKICLIGNNLTSLALSKALVNKKINVTVDKFRMHEALILEY